MKTNITSRVFLEAAKRIDSGKDIFCCLALMHSCDAFQQDQIRVRAMLWHRFAPKESWLAVNDHPWWNKDPTPERQQQRVLALLFMAEICRDF